MSRIDRRSARVLRRSNVRVRAAIDSRMSLNATGDQQMLEYTGAGAGALLSLLLLHDDAKRERKACSTAKSAAFTQALYDEAKAKGWTVVSMKDDWKKILAFE